MDVKIYIGQEENDFENNQMTVIVAHGNVRFLSFKIEALEEITDQHRMEISQLLSDKDFVQSILKLQKLQK